MLHSHFPWIWWSYTTPIWPVYDVNVINVQSRVMRPCRVRKTNGSEIHFYLLRWNWWFAFSYSHANRCLTLISIYSKSFLVTSRYRWTELLCWTDFKVLLRRNYYSLNEKIYPVRNKSFQNVLAVLIFDCVTPNYTLYTSYM